MKRTSFLATLLVLAGVTSVQAQTTAFTYQGSLVDHANPANGTYDVRFILYSDESGGSQVGPKLTNSAVVVAQGSFTTLLDFGAVLDGSPRWLELAVRTNGGGAFVALSPRQALSAAPYAYRAQVAHSVDTVSGSALAGTYSNPVVLNNSGNVLSGSGSGLTTLNASALATGTVPDSRLSPNVARLEALQTFTGSNIFRSANFYNGSGSNGSGGFLHVGGYNANGDPKMIFFGDGQFVSIGERDSDDHMEIRAGVLHARTGALSISSASNSPIDSILDVEGSMHLNDYDLYLRGGSDRNHGLGWYGGGKLFANANIDGPVLYACSGGGLGTVCGSGQFLSLAWSNDGAVAVDPVSQNTNGGLRPGLVFGASSGEGISSKRGPGGNQYGLDFYTGFENRLSLTSGGDTKVFGNLIVSGTISNAAPVTRYVPITVGDLIHQSTVLSGDGSPGIQFLDGVQGGGFISFPLPTDYVRGTPLNLDLFLAANSLGTGTINFFVRWVGHTNGAYAGTGGSITGSPVAAGAVGYLVKQTFTLPAFTTSLPDFAGLTIRRIESDTYNGAVTLVALRLSYQASR